VKDTDFCTYASVDNELGTHNISNKDVSQKPSWHWCQFVWEEFPNFLVALLGFLSCQGHQCGGRDINYQTYMLYIYSTFYFHFCIQLLQLGMCLLTSLPYVSWWTTLCYQQDRGPGACATDIPAEQVKFLPYWPASVVAGDIVTGVLDRWIM
jgi:hypothetical protein